MKQPTLSRSEDSVMLTAPQAMRKFQMSRGILDKVSRDSGAKIVIGRWVRYDSRKID